MTTYFLLFFIISTSGSFTCHDLPVSVEIRFRIRESLFLDQNHTDCNRRVVYKKRELYNICMPPNIIHVLSPKLNTSHRPEFKYLDWHSHYLAIIIFSTNPTT